MYRRSDSFIEDDSDYEAEEPLLFEQLRDVLLAQPGSPAYVEGSNVRDFLQRLVNEPIAAPGLEASADPEGHAAFLQSGMTAAAWELTQLLHHLRTEPGTPYYVDNIVVRRMIRQLLSATENSPSLPTGPSANSTMPQGDAHGAAEFQAQRAQLDRLQGTIDYLRTLVAQVHGDLGTLHRELLWTRLELLNVFGRLGEEVQRQASEVVVAAHVCGLGQTFYPGISHIASIQEREQIQQGHAGQKTQI